MVYGHMATANDTVSSGARTTLRQINVGTGAASAVVTVYNGDATSDPVVAKIDASAAGQYPFGDVQLPDGLFAKLTGGNADVTVIYE